MHICKVARVMRDPAGCQRSVLPSCTAFQIHTSASCLSRLHAGFSIPHKQLDLTQQRSARSTKLTSCGDPSPPGLAMLLSVQRIANHTNQTRPARIQRQISSATRRSKTSKCLPLLSSMGVIGWVLEDQVFGGVYILQISFESMKNQWFGIVFFSI